MLLINNEVASKLLTMRDTMDVLEAVIKEEGLGTAANRIKSAIHIPTEGEEWYRYCSMEGGSRALGVVAIRIKSDIYTCPLMYGKSREIYYASRPGKFCGLIYLFSAVNGEPLAILNDGVIQHTRVGATYGLGAKNMSRPDSKVLGMIGSGGMAKAYAEAVALVRPLRKIKIYSPNFVHRNDYAKEISEKLRLDVVPVDTALEAANDVDLLAAMTDSMEPLIFPEMLRPGIHVCVVKSNTEMSAEAMEKVSWTVEYRSGTSLHFFTTPETWRPPAPGGTTPETAAIEQHHLSGRIHHLSDVLLGRVPGRRNKDDITYFNGEGTGVQFAATAKLVYDRAREQGLGQELPLDWFLQDIRN